MRAKLEGQRFGRLTVVRFDHVDKNDKATWFCQCDCGQDIITTTGNLRIGDTTSCGCARVKHTTPFYSKVRTAWRDMIDRCENPKNEYYHIYGGRGIKVCDRWHSFDAFYADMGEPSSQGMSLDKIDNDQGYSPDNCRWTDARTQGRNRRLNVYVEYKGKIKCASEWAEILGQNEGTFRERIKRGMSVEEILSLKIVKTSQYRGVHRKGDRWIAQIQSGTKRCLGRYLSEREAALAYNNAAIKIYGDKAQLNQL